MKEQHFITVDFIILEIPLSLQFIDPPSIFLWYTSDPPDLEALWKYNFFLAYLASIDIVKLLVSRMMSILLHCVGSKT